MFSYVNVEERGPARDPLRLIREIVNGALAELDGAFDKLYAVDGRLPIAPEQLPRAAFIQLLFPLVRGVGQPQDGNRNGASFFPHDR